MSTVINNPSSQEDSGSNLLIAFVLIVVIFAGMVLFFMYGLPMLQNAQNPNPGTTNINVTVPATTTPPATQTPPKY